MLRRSPELNRDFAIHHLTDLHNQRYFMQVCDENATIMHLLASEGVFDKLQFVVGSDGMRFGRTTTTEVCRTPDVETRAAKEIA